MKAVQYSDYGGPEALRVNETDRPIAKTGQIVVEIKAGAINPFDWKLRAGYMKDAIPLTFPVTIGADFSGIVREVTDETAGFKPGDEVYGSALVLNGGSGALAEYAAVNNASIARKPQNLSFPEAAALVLVGVSAVQALDALQLARGQKIVIHGGAGGIGSVAIQYAKYLGAYVATAVTEADRDFVTRLGADEVVDYEKQKFEDVLHDYDAVFDTIGGDTYDRSLKVLKRGGAIISMNQQPNDQVAGSYGVKALYQSTKVNTGSLNRLTEVINAGAIKPQIDQEFSLEQASAAFVRLETGHPKGKVVIKVG